MLLLMAFISISISLKTFLKITHRCLKEVTAQLDNDLYYSELVI